MLDTPFWWPLDLSPREEEAFKAFRQEMVSCSHQLNIENNQCAHAQLADIMSQYIHEILERDGLPHYCHLLNGWGNATLEEEPLLNRIGVFIQHNQSGAPFILQCDPEGDFHPWQSFAYAIMAGVKPSEIITTHGISLRTLMLNSRLINTKEGRELGHLLFALAHIAPDIHAHSFIMKDEIFSIPELMRMAIEAHHYGSFEVCRKFHLTEGICAAANNISGFDIYRESAQGFLNGQLDMLLLLGIILKEAKNYKVSNQKILDDSLIENLRSTLLLGRYIENHYYYAGHLVELAMLADYLGYTINQRYWNAMAFIINELNQELPFYLSHLHFSECFLALGHYRRAITLFETRISSQEKLTFQDFEKFSVNFDTLSKISTSKNTPSLVNGDIYRVAPSTSKLRKIFEEIVLEYTSTAKEDLKPRGKFDHFRRIGPPAWPRTFHYELLDYGSEIGIEIHMEGKETLPLREKVLSLKEKLTNIFDHQKVDWDPSWYNGFGRLRVVFSPTTSSADIVNGIHKLIAATFQEVNQLACELKISS